MTLFTLLLVLGWERLFKQGEHWQLDHHFAVRLRHLSSPSLIQTLLLSLAGMATTALLMGLVSGLLFGLPMLILWVIIGLLCVGAGEVRLHYRRYLQAALRGEADAERQMSGELALIHGLPVVNRIGSRSYRTLCCGLIFVITWLRCSGLWSPGLMVPLRWSVMPV